MGKLIPLLLLVTDGINPQNFSIKLPESYNDFSGTVLILVYAFAGFDSMTIPAAEVRDPQRSLPFALFATMSMVKLLYVLIQVVCIGTLPGLAESTRPLTDASSRFLGTSGGYIITATIVVSVAGNLIGQVVSTPRILFAMAENRQLPQILASVHGRFRTPYISILFTAWLVLGLALSGTFIQLAMISVIARIAMYASACAALPILRHKKGVPANAFKLPGGVVIAVVSLTLCLWMLSVIKSQVAIKTSIFMVVGLVIYLAFRRGQAGSPINGQI